MLFGVVNKEAATLPNHFVLFSVGSFACGNKDNVFVTTLREKKLSVTELHSVCAKKKRERDGKGKGVDSDGVAAAASTLCAFPEAGRVISFLDSQTARRNDQTEQN